MAPATSQKVDSSVPVSAAVRPTSPAPTANLFGKPPGNEVERAFDHSEGDHEARQQQKRPPRHTEFRFRQGRDNGTHHAQRQPDEENLGDLMRELGEVVAYAVIECGHVKLTSPRGERA